jgi:MFS family permease
VQIRDRRARLSAGAFYLVQGLCFAGLLTQVPTLQHKLGVSDGELTLILPLVPIIAGVGSVLAGVLAPRWGSGILLRVCGPAVPLAILLVGLVPNRAALYPAVALVGLLLGAVDATMNMQGVAVQGRYRRSLLNSFHGWWSVGGILGSLATVLAHTLDWSLAAGLALVAVVGVAVDLSFGRLLLDRAEESAVPAAAVIAQPDATAQLDATAQVEAAASPDPAARPDATAQPGAGGAAAAQPVIPWRPIVLVGLAVMIMYIADSANSNWSTKYLEDTLHAAKNVAPLGLAAYLACQLAGRIAADRQVNRFGPVLPVAVGGAVGAAGLTLAALAPGPWWAIVGFGIVGIGLSVVVPLSFSAAGVLDPTNSGVAIARVNLFNYIGFVVGAGLTGAVADATSLRWAFAVPAVLALGVVALSPAFRVAGRVPAQAVPAAI